MATLKERHPVHALIVGGGRRIDEVRQLAESLGLAGAVHFLGPRPDVPDLLNAMDIFVLPSYSEGVSLALLGGHGGGTAGDRHRGGGPAGGGDGRRQRFIDPAPGRRRPWPWPWSGSWRTPPCAQRLGANARAHVREHFSLDRLGREINEIYEELVEKKFGGS